MFRFAFAEALYGLLLVPLLAAFFRYALRRRQRALERFGDAPLVQRLALGVSGRRRLLKLGLATTAVALLVLAAARPQYGTRLETVRRAGQDIVVALDLSRSMLAEDIEPSRLARAKLAVARLIRGLDGDRIGLVAFAGEAFVQSPLTVDYAAAMLFLNAMDPGLVPVQGTNLGAALSVSLGMFEEAPPQHRLLLLMTDGEDHEGEVDAALERAVETGVRVFAVGFGSPDGVPIPDYDERGRRRGFQKDDAGDIVTTRLDEATLRRIAERTGGAYFRASPAGTELGALAGDIAAMEDREIEARQLTRFEEQYPIFLGLAIALLVLDSLLSEGRRVEAAWRGRFV